MPFNVMTVILLGEVVIGTSSVIAKRAFCAEAIS